MKNEYKIDTLLSMLLEVQQMKSEIAKEYLQSSALQKNNNNYFFYMCRALFVKAGKAAFREPMLGQPEFIGGTNESDWPLFPIDIVDGIPFLIVKSYSLKGISESQSSYLAYCLSNCTWNEFKYKKVTLEEKQSALRSLINSEKFKGKLSGMEVDFLEDQI